METRRTKRPVRRGFTLIELLVVVLIIVLVGAATIKVAIFDQGGRHVSEAARMLQAAIGGARDAAFRANAPRGIRLLPDPEFDGVTRGALAANRMISIEAAPDYNTGMVSAVDPSINSVNVNGSPVSFLEIKESVLTTISGGVSIPNEPTSWFWNIRQGDKLRIGDSGRYYTIAGPINVGAYSSGTTLYNTERYVNFGTPGSGLPLGSPASPTPAPTTNDPNPMNAGHLPEFLQLVNGQDDDGDGWVDEGFDGIDNDGDGIIDPGFNGIDDDGQNGIDDPAELLWSGGGYNGGEYEPDAFVGSEFNSLNIGGELNKRYTIVRRPVVSEGAREVMLPQGVVIDLTTWNATAARVSASSNATAPTLSERSRVPIDPYSHYVDVMISPDGQVMSATPGQSAGSLSAGTATFPTSSMPFYHFWIAEREDVYDPLFGMTTTQSKGTGGTLTGSFQVPIANPNYGATPPQTYLLPMPQGAVGKYISPRNGAETDVPYAPSTPNGPFLKGEMRLVTLFVKTGQVLSYDIGLSDFDPTDTNQPYMQAQFGIREAK